MANYSLSSQEAATNKANATQSVKNVNDLLEQAGENTEIVAYMIPVNFGVEYRQPSGATYTETQFTDKLKELGLIPNS